MVRDATKHGVRFTRVGLESLLNPEGENEVTEEATLEELGREVAGMEEETFQLDEPDPDEEEQMSIEEELACLARARAILERQGELSDSGRMGFSSCQRALRLEKLASMKQTTILDHFRKK